MTRDDLDRLERWCDGTLSAEGLQMWTARLAGDAALAAEVAAELRLVQGLRIMHEPAQLRILAARRAMERTRALIAADRSSRRMRLVSAVMTVVRRDGVWRWRWPVAAAAAFLVAALIWWIAGAPSVAWADGQRLASGATIPAGARELHFADGSVVAIAPGSHAVLLAATGRKALRLDSGALSAAVVPQPAAGSFAVTTPYGEARVHGTRFDLAVAEDSTVLNVTEGIVALQAGTTTVLASAGTRALAADGNVRLLPTWSDRRPLGRLVLSQSPTPGTDANGWLLDESPHAGASTFADRLDAHLDKAIAALRSIDAQGLLLYAIEGGTHQRSAGFVGDPRRVAEFAPAFDAHADAVFARIRSAGLRAGVTVTPWRLEQRDGAWYQMADLTTAEEELENKIAYARQRWGCTLFYINVASPGLAAGTVLPARVLRAVAARHPEVLLLIENPSPGLSPLGAAQVLADRPASPYGLVVRLPWHEAIPSDAQLVASSMHGELILVDPLSLPAIEQMRRARSLPPP